MKMTLKEVYNHVGVTRRAVQGYEKAGLVKPSTLIRFYVHGGHIWNTLTIRLHHQEG